MLEIETLKFRIRFIRLKKSIKNLVKIIMMIVKKTLTTAAF